MSAAVPATPWPAFLPEEGLLQISGADRREAGRLHFSEALLFLLRHVSHPQLSELADWACNEPGNLHTSQISHMRNNKVRMLGTKAVDALGRINQAAWVHRHQPQLLARLGTAVLTPRLEGILAAYQPLVEPASQSPIGAGELMAIYLGYLRLPIEIPRSLTTEEAELLCGLIGEWLDGQISQRGFGFREASRQLQEAWEGEQAGAERLVRVIGGMDDYSPRQLIEDWERISAAAIEVLALEQGPWELADALLELAREQKRPVATVTPIARARRRRSTAKEPSKED
ncbi:hypothetical protein [Vulcanococcus limneticus]|uniref:hypothetical protein n=1 Tax=Vulcanococcus limneticus TaxID=2170428 RepID=UPI00398BD390